MKAIFKNKLTLTIFAVALCLSISVGSAIAYFSDYEEAAGGATLNLGGITELKETSNEDAKEITIKNTGDTNMIVRVAIYGAGEYLAEVNLGDNWIQAGDFYYYTQILEPQAETTQITAAVKQWSEGEAPAFDYEVTVVHESAQAVFDGKELVVPTGWDKNAVASIAIPEVQKGVN